MTSQKVNMTKEQEVTTKEIDLLDPFFLQEALLYRTFEAVITQDFKNVLRMHARLRITKGRLFWQFLKQSHNGFTQWNDQRLIER